MELLTTTIDHIEQLDHAAMQKARERLDNLLKPQGSLGKLEDIAWKLAGMSGELFYSIQKKAIIVMCSDNGITDEKVSAFPRGLSLKVAETMVKGLAGVAVLAAHAGARLEVIDVGLDTDQLQPGIIDKKIRRGTSNMLHGPAMSREEAILAIEIGIEATHGLIDNGVNLLGTGEVGIGNTTTSSAVLAALTGGRLDQLVGRGAGLDDEGLAHKKKVIEQALAHNKPDTHDPLDVLSKVGGFDLAGLVGCYLAAAARKIPIVVDGFISGTAAVVASRLHPLAKEYMISSHGSVEPGARIIQEELASEPMLYMNMRLGEGTGCALAFHLIEAAMYMMRHMGTFADIGM